MSLRAGVEAPAIEYWGGEAMTTNLLHMYKIGTRKSAVGPGLGAICVAAFVSSLSVQSAEASPIGLESASSLPQVTISQQVDFAFGGTSPVSGSAWIEPWDPALGISLDEVHISLTGSLVVTAVTAPGGERTAAIQLDSSGAADDGFSFELSPGRFDFDDGVNDTDEPAVSIFTSDFELDFAFDQITDFTGLSFPTHAAGEAFDPSIVASAWREGFIGNPGNDIEQIFSFTHIAGGSDVGDITGQGQLDITYLYTIPEPGTAALLAIGGIILLVRPRSTTRSLASG